MSREAEINFVNGRRPKENDDRDWKVSEILNGTHLERLTGTDLDKSLVAVLKSGWTSAALKQWAKEITQAVKDLQKVPTPTPTPTPTPIPTTPIVRWKAPTILDQGQTPHCVGFTGADFIGDEPVLSEVNNALGDALYYECKIIDGEAGQENGSDMRSIGKVLKNRGRIDAYAFAVTVDEIRTWVRTNGPVLMGTNWYNSMFHPDPRGMISIAGSIAGGHAWSIIGHDATPDIAAPWIAQNHWGTNWADKGFFYFDDNTLSRLLSEQGDALVTMELP
jgi:hypothetical protein